MRSSRVCDITILICGVLLAIVGVRAFRHTVAYEKTRMRSAEWHRLVKKPFTRSFSSHFAEHQQPENSLSGLVNGMLEAQKEFAKEARELANLQINHKNPALPLLGDDGVYGIWSEEQLRNFFSAHSNELVILKFSSPVCKACRDLKQKFRHLDQSPSFAGKPVVFADIIVSNNKNVQDPFRDYVTSQLQIRKIPSIQFYGVGTQLINTVGCDPETGCSWSKIKLEMIQFVDQFGTEISQKQPKQNVATSVQNVSFADQDKVISETAMASATAKRMGIFQNRILSLFFSENEDRTTGTK